ncbi:gastrula zinc finger protein XlCGF67.1-like [Amphibalanus amphitrite]|uniref:gastrula zinc finger protein XlCGF67.1-like n=1 Tax=Amphibalanus amphitrite TaxID=1232801 RepID=UPI001C90CEAA|nr:gastrula zinc finger protein XlCGF67.1-like [Amphibalanus amphitrite]XP_043214553.1 gastrula zinc finger protein XlCGF67.1-like [Amphibalanus amphitrite]XP_043214554.1 gastrula zinc finger protein XlCGF67.1-like [Amphibalanus amphitrite]XP_043214555.1 gastrula zinc finger protein XlCGF67.1-like [Amphibalanus amphitrite]XP_043214556.1 gastrula zinc finger protein XlCGF67.1-like [Amphibalanus amphitrite]
MSPRRESVPRERHSCTTCAVSYTHRTNLERHVRERHSGQQHVCDRCGATFTRRYRLEAHVRTHDGGEEPFRCSLCPATAASRAGLARHVRCHAAAGGGTACPDCGQVFSHYWRMKLHRRHHRAPRFGCQLCGRLFRHNRGLTDHLAAEHGSPPAPAEPLPIEPELGLPADLGLLLGTDSEPEPTLGPALGPAPDSEPEPDSHPGLGAEPLLPELQIELDSSELGGELGAELAQLLGDGVRMEVQQSTDTAADEAVMVITLVDE